MKKTFYVLGGPMDCEVVKFKELRHWPVRYICSTEGHDIYEHRSTGDFYAVEESVDADNS